MAQKVEQHQRQQPDQKQPDQQPPDRKRSKQEVPATKEEMGRIVQLFEQMPAHYKDRILKGIGASGIVRQKRRSRVTNESAASLVHTAGDVIHPAGHMAVAAEWVYEKGPAFLETWQTRWEDGRPYLTEGNLAFEYDEDEFSPADMVGELAPTG